MSKLTWDVEPLVGSITQWTSAYDGIPIIMLDGIINNNIKWYVEEISAEGTEETTHAAQFAAVQAIRRHRDVEFAGITDEFVTVDRALAAEATTWANADASLGTNIDAGVTQVTLTEPLPASVTILIGENGSFFQGNPVEFTNNFGLGFPLTAMDVEAVANAIDEPYTIE